MKTFLTTLSIFVLLNSLPSIAYSSTDTDLSRTETVTILIYGDSLSAGYGLPQNTGWVSLLKKN